MIKTYSFPSVYEATLQDFALSNDPILNFSKLKYNGSNYLVGLQALNEGVSPHKFINPSPEDIDYKIISQSALVLATQSLQSENKNQKIPKAVLTAGFPYATYLLNKDHAIDFFKEDRVISYFKADDEGVQHAEQISVSIKDVNIIPELVGCDTSIRKGENPIDSNFILISIGYGTCEGAVSTSEGLSARTLFSSHGISYAVNIFTQEVAKNTYLNMRTEHQIDHLFTKGYMFVNRKRKDFINERKNAISLYYNNVISPTIRRYITDSDFELCQKMVLVGGGALYKELVALFQEEFGEFLTVIVADTPEKCASKGYALYSKLNHSTSNKDGIYSSDDSERVVYLGLDIGNANTSVSIVSTNGKKEEF